MPCKADGIAQAGGYTLFCGPQMAVGLARSQEKVKRFGLEIVNILPSVGDGMHT